MQFVSYRSPNGDGAGVLDEELIYPFAAGEDVLGLLDQGTLVHAGEQALGNRAAALALDSVQLRAPIPRPPTVRDFMVFEKHVEGMGMGRGITELPAVWTEQPVFYFTSPYAIIGPYDDVPMPPGCVDFDFELEVAVVVGKAGIDLTVQQAEESIAGYTILNDWTARDLQRREMSVGLGPAKGKDSATTLGPVLVTPDELAEHRRGDVLDLALSAEINGVPFGQDNLANMSYSFAEMIAYASRGAWVRPGDVLGSGTCANGCLAEMWGREGRVRPPLIAGDVVSLTVQGIGTVRNTVLPATSELQPIPGARRRSS